MSSKAPNPLTKHFRQPAIYFKLPSNGEYWPPGSINMSPTGDMPVYPMTAQDEITLKTPDALMNGQGQVNVIKSCCPNIVDPWKMPSIDVDATLLAIRIASYGDTMEFSSKCPACNEEHNYGLPLSTILESIRPADYKTPVSVDGLAIKLAPQLYFSLNNINLIKFEESRMLQTLNNSELDDTTKAAEMEKRLQKLVELNIKVLADSTESITTPEGIVVTDKEQISEYYNNASNQVIKTVQKRLEEINEENSIKPQPAVCQDCNTPFDIPIVFDYSNFFV